MFRCLVLLLVTVAVLICPDAARGQDCSIGVYADAAGTISEVIPWNWDPYVYTLSFSIYVVIFAEDTVAAAAYKLSEANGSVGLFEFARYPGPTRSGLFLNETPATIGTNVALGECVLGFGGRPVLVEEYWFVAADWHGSEVFYLEPNINQNPDYPEYVTCNYVQRECRIGPSLSVGTVLPIESRSFSAIKSLY